jgi:uncharacterized Zn-binding protein involved in type VI secretion
MLRGVARLGDLTYGECSDESHNKPLNIKGKIITASPNIKSDNRPVARLGDMVMSDCGHTSKIITASPNTSGNTKGGIARLADLVGGGPYKAKIITASPTTISSTSSFIPFEVPPVSFEQAVVNVDAEESNSKGRAEADRFLAEGRITPAQHAEAIKDSAPTTEGVKPGEVVAGKNSDAVTGDVSFNTVLTPNGTTLGTMIQRVAFPRTIGQLNQFNSFVKSRDNVVSNLAALALNCYEPIKSKYPGTFITNSFRHNNQRSQHGAGQAMDLQFRGVRAHDYYNIAVWISKNVSYDQLLLEYIGGRTVWIHVSYAIPNLPYGGISVRKSRGVASTLATLNGASGGRFVVNLHNDIIVNSVPNNILVA